LGGGLELALGCDWRIATPRCRLGLPEVTLGMVPGAGGTQRLPRLVGRAAAVDLIVSGRRIDGSSAHRLGLVDEVVEPAVLLDRAVAAARRVGKRPVRRLPVPDEGDRPVRRLPVPDEGDRPVPDAAKPGRPQRPPVAEAIRLVQLAGGGPIDEALAEERRVFDDLRRRPEARALRHLFFAESRASKVDEVGTVRCYAAYRRQCEFMLEEGALPEQVDQALVDFGFARGPFAEADLSGLDTAGATRRRRIRRRALDPVEILDRAVFALVNEAALVLDEGVVPRPGDIDVAFVLRYGFPRHEGGPLWWAAHQPPQRVGAGMARVAETTGYGYRAGPVEEVLSAIRAAG
jgi:enoyl-CoA hydratase/carnithine racemase